MPCSPTDIVQAGFTARLRAFRARGLLVKKSPAYHIAQPGGVGTLGRPGNT